MIQYICNRCRKKLSDFEIHEVFVTHRDDHDAGEDDDCYHLCGNCRQHLKDFMNGKAVSGISEEENPLSYLEPFDAKRGTDSPIYDGDYPSSFCEVVDHEDAESGANDNYVEVEYIEPANTEKVRNMKKVFEPRYKKVFEPRYVGDIAEGPRDSCYVGDSE